jgi:hypothetical protein
MRRAVKRVVLMVIIMVMTSLLAILAIRIVVERELWSLELENQSGLLGGANARQDAGRGVVRLLELSSGDVELHNTGRKEGSFEVWSWPGGGKRFFLLGDPGRIVAAEYVRAYNSAMHDAVGANTGK